MMPYRNARPTVGALAAACFILVAGAVWSGCAQDAESAQTNRPAPASASEQDGAVVPSDPRVAGERADRARVKGAEDAPIRVVEISDFQCPFCKQFYGETMGAIDSAYVESGQISYVWISYANPGHPRAWTSIEAAFCAGTVGKFWPMHDILFDRQDEWSGAEDPHDVFVGYAAELGIDVESFSACVRNDLVAPLMLRDYSSVMRAGISSTPYFILADSVAIRGAAGFDTFRTAIDTLLVVKG